jgi:hypothetical protein
VAFHKNISPLLLTKSPSFQYMKPNCYHWLYVSRYVDYCSAEINLITINKTVSLTTWSAVIFQKLIVAKLLNILHNHGIWRFITILLLVTSPLLPVLGPIVLIHTHLPASSRSILILSTHLVWVFRRTTAHVHPHKGVTSWLFSPRSLGALGSWFM